MKNIYNSIRKTTAPPTKLFNNKKDELKNKYLNYEIKEEIYNMNKEDIVDRFNELKTYLLNDIYKKSNDQLDEPYVIIGDVTHTLRELAIEIENESQVGKRIIYDILGLAINLFIKKIE